MLIAYVAVERLSSANPSWSNYVKWSGLDHLTEVVGLDELLCRPLFDSYTEEDWRHVVPELNRFGAFDECDYAQKRMKSPFDSSKHQILAIAREPTNSEVTSAHLPGFTFLGFDLVEDDRSVSALTNCGGFDDAFKRDELSTCGLLISAERAYAIRDRLRQAYPEEPHANCPVWAVWRLDVTG